jgi:hypothetical protein
MEPDVPDARASARTGPLFTHMYTPSRPNSTAAAAFYLSLPTSGTGQHNTASLMVLLEDQVWYAV